MIISTRRSKATSAVNLPPPSWPLEPKSVNGYLPSVALPEQVAGYRVQHQFRTAEDAWPLLQVGPGILTLNDTEGYKWEHFRERGLEAVEKLFDAYPQSEDLRVNNLLLRYIDAAPFDFAGQNIFSFLSEKMGVCFSLPDGLFEKQPVSDVPTNFRWQASFMCEEPAGHATLKFATGKRDDERSLVWETIVQSAGEDVPPMPDEFGGWLEEAHEITHGWFFELIGGELEEKYRG